MRFVILHGTSADHASNWFPWLKSELEALGHSVWVPDLPDSSRPNIAKYNELLFGSGFDFSGSVVIGHSSGSVAILGLLRELPAAATLNTAILVGAFTERLAESPSWEMLSDLFNQPFDFDAIKKKADRFIFLHSTDDPYCPIEQAEFLSEKLDGTFHRFEGKGHFSKSLDPQFDKLPEILEIIKRDVL